MVGKLVHTDCFDIIEIDRDHALVTVSVSNALSSGEFTFGSIVGPSGFQPLQPQGKKPLNVIDVFEGNQDGSVLNDDNSNPFLLDSLPAFRAKRTIVGSICAIQACSTSRSVWKLTLDPTNAAIVSANLMLTAPVAKVFDASISETVGVCAVAITSSVMSLTKSPKIVSSRQVSTSSVVTYHPASGWTPWKHPAAGPPFIPMDIRLSIEGSFFVVVFRNESTGVVMIIHSIAGLIWSGASYRPSSLRISDDSQSVLWHGQSPDVTRLNSTHCRVFISTCSQSTKAISPVGALVVSFGFFSNSGRAWFTTQSGVLDLATYFFDPAENKLEVSSGPPVTGFSATRTIYRTESLDEYPSIVFPDFHLPLPRSLGAESLRTLQWKHPTRCCLEGVLHTVTMGSAANRPLLIHVHGGPAMAVSPFRRSLIESNDWFLPLVLKGFDILSITYSGSFGFGDEHAQSVLGKQPQREMEDLVDAILEVQSKGKCIAGIFGGSYGGYLGLHAYCSSDPTLASIPRIAALYPYISTRGCVAETGDFAWEAEYCNLPRPNEWPIDPSLKADILPLLYQADVSRPLLLFHGDQDDVCPISQSRQTYSILRQRGAGDNVSLTVYKGESHGFRDPEVRADCIARIVEFFS